MREAKKVTCLETVLAAARQSFLYVSVDCLLLEDMADNKPNAALGVLAHNGALTSQRMFWFINVIFSTTRKKKET